MHRLVVATYFGQPCSPELQVNHKDSDRGNNHVQNLEYVTPSENQRHSWLSKPRSINGRAVEARLVGETKHWSLFCSITAAARHTGVNPVKISRICQGLDSSTHWEFKLAQEVLPGEEWRPVVLDGARRPSSKGLRNGRLQPAGTA